MLLAVGSRVAARCHFLIRLYSLILRTQRIWYFCLLLALPLAPLLVCFMYNRINAKCGMCSTFYTFWYICTPYTVHCTLCSDTVRTKHTGKNKWNRHTQSCGPIDAIVYFHAQRASVGALGCAILSLSSMSVLLLLRPYYDSLCARCVSLGLSSLLLYRNILVISTQRAIGKWNPKTFCGWLEMKIR